MLSGNPIEVLTEEAKALVKPDTLRSVLETLKTQGLIEYYVIGRKRLLIWENPKYPLEASAFFFDENRPALSAIKPKRRAE